MPPTLLHTGIYSIPEAARYTGLEESRVRRWLSGYSFTSSGKKHSSPPVWTGQLPVIKGRRAVAFRDLIEMRFVDAFLRAGVSWKTIRDVQETARREFNLDHPFSTNRFRADGSSIVMEVTRDDRQAGLFDLHSRQQVFFDAAEPLRGELELNDHDQVCRWWPLGRDRAVMLDPARQWGRPVTARTSVPVDVITRLLAIKLSVDAIAAWLEAGIDEIEDAIAFAARGGEHA